MIVSMEFSVKLCSRGFGSPENTDPTYIIAASARGIYIQRERERERERERGREGARGGELYNNTHH